MMHSMLLLLCTAVIPPQAVAGTVLSLFSAGRTEFRASGSNRVDRDDDAAAPMIHCQPGASPPQFCPGRLPCPPSGVCPLDPLGRCTDIRKDVIIGEGQMEFRTAPDAGECCSRCLATESCECWTFKTAGRGRGDCMIKNTTHCQEASHRFAEHRISGRRPPRDPTTPDHQSSAEERRSHRTCSIVTYGAMPGNHTADAVRNAMAIQQALAHCARVTVPADAIFKLTPIVLPSHTELYLERGARLVGSERWSDYGTSHMLPPLGNSGTQPGLLMINPLISANNVINVSITGANGTIDGNGWAGWPSANWSNPACGLHHRCAKTRGTGSDAPGTVRPPQLLAFTRSSWLTITNITLTNPA
jgi:hypothetical protein